MEETKPVEQSETEQNAGTVQPESEQVKSDVSPEVLAAAIEQIEANDKALAAAETKIVSLKRKMKGEDGEDDLDERINRILEEREQTKQPESDADIQAARKKNAELIEALRAKQTISNTSVGNNQVRSQIEEDLTKKYSPQEIEVLSRVASRKKVPLKEYLKTIKP